MFTHQGAAGYALRDDGGPRLLVLAATAVFSGCGVLLAVERLAKGPRYVVARAIVLVGVACALVASQWAPWPSGSTGAASEVADEIMAGCPPDAILFSGDPALTSLVIAAQQCEGKRHDLVVLPAPYLANPVQRRRLSARIGERASLSVDYPPRDAVEVWRREAPMLVLRLLEGRAKGELGRSSLEDLALWDFVKENAARRPLCFMGMSSAWLTARAQVSGCVLIYPRREAPVAGRVERLLRKNFVGDHVNRRPDASWAIYNLLLPLAEAARRQDRGDEAYRLGRLATIVCPGKPQAWLGLARVSARAGRREATMEFAAGHLHALAAAEDDEGLSEVLGSDFERYGAVEAFRAELAQESEKGVPRPDVRKRAAAELWDWDELAVLAEGYGRLLEAFPTDESALYQRAAALAQLGDLEGARQDLSRWIRVSQRSEAEMVACIREDGRLALLRTYVPEEVEPESPEVEREGRPTL